MAFERFPSSRAAQKPQLQASHVYIMIYARACNRRAVEQSRVISSFPACGEARILDVRVWLLGCIVVRVTV